LKKLKKTPSHLLKVATRGAWAMFDGNEFQIPRY